MKKLCIAILVFTAAVSSFAQKTKTVTNEDLEKFRQQRVEAEKRLRERYAELGFPAPEQIARQNDARRAEMEEYSDVLRQRRLESQNEIVAEANELRAEIAAVDAQLNYLRSQTGGSTYKGGTVSDLSGYSYGYAPFGVYGGYRNYRGNRGYRGNRLPLAQISRLPQNMRTVQEYGAMYPSSQSIYRQSLGNTRTGGRLNYNNRGYYRGGGYAVAPVIVGGVYNANDARAEISYLEQQRAGLLARWQILEEQARRAGIRLN